MHPRINCDFCGSSSLSTLISNICDYENNIHQKIDLLECKDCNLVQQNLLFTNRELSGFYNEEYHGRNYKKNFLLSNISNFLRRKYYLRFINIAKDCYAPKNIRILDYGSGDGFLLYLLHELGYSKLYSCDFFPPSTISRNLITHLSPNELKNYTGSFDIIFMINSIEHLSSFRGELNVIKDCLRRDGMLIIETPNLGSPDFFIFQKVWGGLHQPRHTYLWSKASISRHLNQMGFEIKHIGSPQSAHWAISIQNLFSKQFPFFKKFIKNGRIKGYVILVLLTFPLGIIQNALKKESVLNIIATKNQSKIK